MNYKEILKEANSEDLSLDKDSAKIYKKTILSPEDNPFQVWDEFKIRAKHLISYNDYDYLDKYTKEFIQSFEGCIEYCSLVNERLPIGDKVLIADLQIILNRFKKASVKIENKENPFLTK